MFSAGSIFVDVGARYSRKGFEAWYGEIDRARGQAPVDVQLGGHVARRGFIAFADNLRASQDEAVKFASGTQAQFDRVGAAGQAMAGSTGRSLMAMRDQLSWTARDYRALGASAQESAAVQDRAFAQMRAGAASVATANAHAAKSSEASWKKGLSTLAGVGKAGLIGGAITGGLSLKWAADYQKALNLLYTQAGLSRKEVANLDGQLIKMGRTVGVTPKQLADGMYHIASSHVAAGNAAKDQADRLHILMVAAKGAKAGNDDMVSVTNALTAAMNAFKIPVKDVAATMGELDRIAGQGNMVMKDLTSAMTTGVLNAAGSLGLKLKDVGAALDTMTRLGVPAEQAATRLRTTFSLIANPTAKATKALAELGINQTQLAEDMRKHGLAAALEDLQKHMKAVYGTKLTDAQKTEEIARYQKQLISMGVTGTSLDKQVKAFTKSLDDQGSGAVKASQLINSAFGGARMGTTMVTMMQNIDGIRHSEEQLGVSNARNTQLFREHWQETQKTFSQQASEFWSAIQGLGIQLGEKLMPAAERAMKALEDFGHWLGKHDTAAKVLAYTIGSILAVAITAFFIKLGMRLANAIKNIYELGKAIGSIPGKLAGWGKANADIAKSDGDAAAATDKMTGSVDALTGALDRQIAVAKAAATEMKDLAIVEGEMATSGGLIVPRGSVVPKMTAGTGYVPQPGVAAGEAEALAAGGAASGGGASMFSRVRRGARGLGGRALSGGMLYFLGSGAADLAGSAIGGKAGRDVSTIGGDAAKGAGLGMLLGPEGALAGGVIGGLVGAFKSFLGSKTAADYGDRIANQVEHGMGKIPIRLTSPEKHTIDAASKKIGEDIVKSQGLKGALEGKVIQVGKFSVRIPAGNTSEINKQLDKIHADIQQRMNTIGLTAGRSFMKGLEHSSKFWTEPALFMQMQKRLNSLPPQARAAAANSMVEMASQMQKDGRLPKGSLNTLVQDLKDNVDGLGPSFNVSSSNAMNEISLNIRKNHVVDDAGKLIDNLHTVFGDFPKLAKTNGQNAAENMHQAMQFLRAKVESTTGDAQKAAKNNLHELQKQVVKYAGITKKQAGQHFTDFLQGVTTVMSGLGGVVSTGLSDIGLDVNNSLKDLGAKAIKFTVSHPKKAANEAGNIVGTAVHLFQSGLAVGGIPNPSGTHRDDHVLFDPQGNPVAALSGTEGIFNDPQMAVVDDALAATAAMGMQPYPSKEALWGSGMRHYDIGGMLQRADNLERLKLPYKWGGHHGDQGLIRNPRPGLDCSSTVSYVLGIPPRVSSQFENFGKPGPGPITIYANAGHTFMKIGRRYFGTSGFGHPDIGGGPGWFTIDPSQSYLKGFTVRHVGTGFGPGSADSIKLPILDGPQGWPRVAGEMGLIDDTNAARRAYNRALNRMDNASGQPLADVAGSPAQARRWTEQGMRLAGVSGTSWESMLLRQEQHESTYNPNAVNNTDINARMGNPSKGIMQITGSNFARYHVRGHNNIFNPVDNIGAAIKYIIARYGHGSVGTALNFMIRNGGAAYRAGGHLSRRAARVAHNVLGRAAGDPHGFSGVLARSASTRKPPRPPRAPHARTHQQHLHHPTRVHGVGDLQKFDLPSLAGVNKLDTSLGDTDTFYQQASRYFAQQDPTLTSTDVETLLDLMGTSGALGHPGEAAILQKELPALTSARDTLRTDVHDVRHEARTTFHTITHLEDRLARLTRRGARVRHHDQGLMMQIADKLARELANVQDKRNNLADREQVVRDQWDAKITAARRATPVVDVSGQVAAIRSRYRTLIQNEPTTAGRNRLRDQMNREIRGVERGARAKRRGYSQHVSGLVAGRHNALAGFERQRRGLTRQSEHISREEAAHRRKFAHKGWAQLWKIQTEKWRVEDKLKRAREKEYKLTGSTAHIGKGGQLGKLTGALTTVRGRIDTTESAIQDNAMNELDLVIQDAQAKADESGHYVELLGPGATAQPIEDDQGQEVFVADPTTGAATKTPVPYTSMTVPSDIAKVLAPMGLMGNRFRRMLAPATGTGVTAGTAGTGVTGTDTGGTGTDTPPTAQQLAAAVIQELSTLSSASSDLFSQFGSNVVAANPQALRSALSGAGSPYAPGARFFGAAGGGAGVETPPQNVFNQTNHYDTGPEDPHIHAQVSKMEFQGAFG